MSPEVLMVNCKEMQLDLKLEALKLPPAFAREGKEGVSAWLRFIELRFAAQSPLLTDNQKEIRSALSLTGVV